MEEGAAPPPSDFYDGTGWEASSSGWDTPAGVDIVMSWDDSGALEALEMCRQRKNARELGLPYEGPAARPGLYNEDIDWNSGSGDTNISPEVAEAWKFIEDREKHSSSSSSNGGRRRRGGRKSAGYGIRKTETAAPTKDRGFAMVPTGWGDEVPVEAAPTGWGEPSQHRQQQEPPQFRHQVETRPPMINKMEDAGRFTRVWGESSQQSCWRNSYHQQSRERYRDVGGNGRDAGGGYARDAGNGNGYSRNYGWRER